MKKIHFDEFHFKSTVEKWVTFHFISFHLKLETIQFISFHFIISFWNEYLMRIVHQGDRDPNSVTPRLPLPEYLSCSLFNPLTTGACNTYIDPRNTVNELLGNQRFPWSGHCYHRCNRARILKTPPSSIKKGPYSLLSDILYICVCIYISVYIICVCLYI